MELRQLRDFVVLAEELHYARAAARLGIDQSPLSRRIKEFEIDLGFLLFARTSRGTQLTPRGEFLLPWARSILGAADQVQKLLKSSAPLQTTIRILLCNDVPCRSLFPVLSHFQKTHPELLLSYAERRSEQQFDEIRAELADVGFTLGSSDSAGLVVDSLWMSDACLVLPHDPSVIDDGGVTDKPRGNARLGIIRGDGSSYVQRAQIESLARRLTANPNLAEADSLRTLLGMITLGTCVGVLAPAHAEMIQAVDFRIRPIDQPEAKFTTRMIYREREKVPAIRALIETVRQAWKDDCAGLSERRDPVR